VQGWIRTTEVTRGSVGSAHPHFHTLMMVPPSMFTRDYVKHARWGELWRESLRVDYDPNVDVRAENPRKLKDG
ncbi:protein rep, partial [Salmonella enterica]|uniref:protein rep n=1 Tax=Salmonella enterica TaxID=28901 RepID=UPI000BDA2CED